MIDIILAIELDKLEGSARIERFQLTPHLAHEIIIEPVGKNCMETLTTELNVLIKNYNHEKIFCVGNRISIPYYGKKLIYKITNAKTDENLVDKFSKINISDGTGPTTPLFIALYSTKWTVVENSKNKSESKNQKRYGLECVGGYSKLIEDLKDVFNIGLFGEFGNMENFKSKGILLYGPSGVGKSMISKALLSEIKAHVVNINASDMNSKNFKETEVTLRSMFNEAFEKAPSIIFIEDIDNFCPKKTGSMTVHEKQKVLTTLVTLFDSLQDNDKNVMVLATAKPDAVDSSLRQRGRIDKEFEIPVPTKQIRKEILLKLIEKMPHSLSDEDIEQIAYETHGFVGADIHSLCSEAVTNVFKNKLHAGSICDSDDVLITRKDFKHARTVVNPSAMKELLVDVPNVKWSDIGGQKDLKLKLNQSVEWPLKHPEIFPRLGILPPKGILMFGPPGCSKTMIAKALATESKLNFLNIKVIFQYVIDNFMLKSVHS